MSDNRINIPSTIKDANYRYRMPRMILRIEGGGNGIMTNITNLAKVAEALAVPTEYILKFFTFDLNTMAHYRENGKKDVTTIINGAKTDEQMMNSLDKFILKYVCCPSKCPANEECTYPEMHLRVKKQKVTGECDACGFRGELDNQHKVAAFIVKNPPVGSDEPKVKDPSLGSPTKNSPVSNKLNGIAQPEMKEQSKVKAKKIGKEELNFDSPLLLDILSALRDVFVATTAVEKDPDIIAGHISAKLKEFNIEKTLYDRLAFLIFQSIFNISIYKQLKDHAALYRIMLSKFNIPNQPLETLVNLQYLMMLRNKDLKALQCISPIMQELYNEELLGEDEFLLKWDSGQYEGLENHFLYLRERDEAYKMHAKEFIEWLTQPEEEEQEETEDREVKKEPKVCDINGTNNGIISDATCPPP